MEVESVGGGGRRRKGREEENGERQIEKQTRRMIYAFFYKNKKVALQQIKELPRRGIKQDDNALLPGEFLGRCCFVVCVCLHRCCSVLFSRRSCLPTVLMSAGNHVSFPGADAAGSRWGSVSGSHTPQPASPPSLLCLPFLSVSPFSPSFPFR